MSEIKQEYQFPIYLFNKGENYRAYEFFGAHRIKEDTFAKPCLQYPALFHNEIRRGLLYPESGRLLCELHIYSSHRHLHR